jgi:hypothetical protein
VYWYEHILSELSIYPLKYTIEMFMLYGISVGDILFKFHDSNDFSREFKWCKIFAEKQDSASAAFFQVEHG